MQIKAQPVNFNNLPGWTHDDHLKAFESFLRSAQRILSNQQPQPDQHKHLPLKVSDFLDICAKADKLSRSHHLSSNDARAFFENHFTPVKLYNNCQSSENSGLVTGYYEPEIAASFTPDKNYPYPLYKKPHDLVSSKLIDRSKYQSLETYQFVRKTSSGYEVHPDRKQIEQGFLCDRKLEIAYLANRADAYFTHIQGSAKLYDDKGGVMRVTYDAKSGHPYTSIGKILVDRGEIEPDLISMQTIRTWMFDHPEKIDELLWQNRSFIFFKEALGLEPDLGPVGAAKIQLTPLRSLAVDKNIYTYGLPIFVASQSLRGLDENKRFEKLMIAQDTGSAIVGINRGDIFIGSGEKAGQMAGHIQHQAEFFTFLPKVGRS